MRLKVYSDPELTTPLADGTYEMVEKSFDVVGGLITKITEAIETPETPETEVQEDMISELTAQIELLKDENEKLKKICADYEIDITNLKSDIEKFKSNEFKMKKEIEKLGNEPEVKSLNRINLASEIKKGSLSSFNDTRNFLKSIVE